MKKGILVTSGIFAITPFVTPAPLRPSKTALIEAATTLGFEISFDLYVAGLAVSG